MRFYSTSQEGRGIALKEALERGFAPDGGLYLPAELPFFSQEDLLALKKLSFPDMSCVIAKRLLSTELSEEEITSLVAAAFDFPVPVISFPESLYGLELFHGPSLSFKDFGARFMAQLVHKLWKSDKPLGILVATTGDTGSAVGMAFKGIPHTHVFILFPKGRVTPSQEMQLTTIGGNVTAIEVEGTFDACQQLLKQAVLDPALRQACVLTTGNSINIARLLPQTFYFFYAYCQMKEFPSPFFVSVPCGNFGHLASAVLAKRMGVPIARLIAGTNINEEVPLFLKSGVFQPHASLQTLAVSMDVGNPSNFSRLTALYHHSLSAMRREIIGASFTDEEICAGMRRLYQDTGYSADPHSIISYLALNDYLKMEGKRHPGLFLVTAHPAKFLETVQPLIPQPIPVPERLQVALSRQKQAVHLSNSYSELKSLLEASLALKS